MSFVLFLLSTALGEVTELSDGITKRIDSTESSGASFYFKFLVRDFSGLDLVVSLTSFSDYPTPPLLVSAGKQPTFDNFDYGSFASGSSSIAIPYHELEPNTDYFISVLCSSFCGFSITINYAQEVILEESTPIDTQLAQSQVAPYVYFPNCMNDTVSITLSKITGNATLSVHFIPFESMSDLVYLNVETKWDGSLEARWSGLLDAIIFRITVRALDTSKYTLMARCLNSEPIALKAGVSQNGEVITGGTEYYYINVLDPESLLMISLTMLSGDGNLYVKCNYKPYLFSYDFSSVHSGNENLVISQSDRKRIDCETGKYYIGVFGNFHAVYSLIVSTSSNRFIELTSGIPQSGSVSLKEFEYYSLASPKANTNLTVYVSVSSGNPDLYLKFCTVSLSDCTNSDDQLSGWSSSSLHFSGSESIEIAHQSKSCRECWYLIGVYGASEYSVFTVTAVASSTDEILLREGRPQSITQQKGEVKYFKYNIVNSVSTEVQFMLSPIYGNPDLYVSFNKPCSTADYDKCSVNNGAEVDQVVFKKGVDMDSLEGMYHFLVATSAASSYSIVVSENIPQRNLTLQIYPGHPQKDTIYNETHQDSRVYTFSVSFTNDTQQPVTISLTPISGRFTLYAANDKSNIDRENNKFYYNWKSSDKSSTDHSQMIKILPTDADYKPQGTYLILVMATAFLPDNSATYIITYTVGNGSAVLPEGIPTTGVVSKSEYVYYSFPVHISHEDITISLTTLSGNPDLYISVSSPNPSRDNYDFKATTPGSDTLTLIWEEALKEKCPPLPDLHEFGSKSNCQLHISVFGSEASTFTIRVNANRNLPVLLALGEPSFGNLTETMYDFYYAFADATQDIRLVLQSINGDADLYVRVIEKTAKVNSAEWSRPSKASHDFASQSTIMSEEIKISSSQLLERCPDKTCVVLIGSSCYTERCAYSISALQSQLQVLIENEPTYGYVNSSVMYYSYYCDKNDTDFLVTLTVLNDGNPDLFISRGSESRPSAEASEWQSSSWGSDAVLITKSDPVFNSGSMKATYIIAVSYIWGSASFTIMVNNHPNPILKLVPGVSLRGNLTANSVAYYSFANYIKEDIIIRLTPSIGSGQIFITTQSSWESALYAHLPSASNFHWSSSSSQERYAISITPDDPNFCIYCDYLIAVIADNNHFAYSLNAKSIFGISVLQNGIPMKSEALDEKWGIFSFEVLQHLSFDISVSVYSGHPSMYVTTNKTLASETYSWEAYYIEEALTLRINKTDNDFKLGLYYIIVAGSERVSFAIVAHTRNSAVTIIDGWPIIYQLHTDAPDNVNMKHITSIGSKVSCTVEGSKYFRPTVYARFQSPTSAFTAATESTSQFVFDASKYKEPYSELIINLGHLPDQNQLNLGIYSSLTSGNSTGKLLVFCSSSSESSVVKIGSRSYETLSGDLIQKRFELVTASKGTLEAFVIPCTGAYKLEISNSWNVITQESPDVLVSRLTDGVIYGSIAGANGRYFVSVTTLNTSDTSTKAFELVSSFTKAGETLHKRFSPGNNGMISWSIVSDEKVRISWSAVESETGVEKDLNVAYQVYFGKLPIDCLLTACGIRKYESTNELKLLGSTLALEYEVKLPGMKGIINVIAMLPKESVSPIKEIVYDPTEILIIESAEYSRISQGLYWGMASLLLITVGLSIYFYRRKKRAENILNYEMSDIRNITYSNVVAIDEDEKKNDSFSRLN